MSNLAQKVAGRQSGIVIIASGIRARLHWLTTVTVCWTWVTAAWYRVSPAWLASRTQVPTNYSCRDSQQQHDHRPENRDCNTRRILFTDYRRPLKTFMSSFRAAIGLYFFKESLA
jgi:hypothetical protein